MAKSSMKPTCSGAECDNEAGTLQCPTCLKLGLEVSYFCSQECFKNNWADHKLLHKKNTGIYNPFPSYPFTGSLRPVYPLTPRRKVPDHIAKPDWYKDGIPKYSPNMRRLNKHEVLDQSGQQAMRTVCRLAREVLDIAAAAIRPGITTDYLDEIVHNACIERNAYPSPLNYNHFPKSLCTSPNEVICHGIPDQRVLLDGDILNLDVSLYFNGYHGDVNETYHVLSPSSRGPSPSASLVVDTARECLSLAIAQVKPGTPLREFGAIIEKHAKSKGCSVVKSYCGHGIHTLFHCPPDILHYERNKSVGVCKPGMTFTIEPMITLGLNGGRDRTWPDGWTAVSVDGALTAQFEHTLLVTEDGVEVLTAQPPDSPGGPLALEDGASDF
ncbi:Peptidase M24, structural domain containing protein [Rhypophila decipiens]